MVDSLLFISTDKALTSQGAVNDTLDLGLAGYGPGDPIQLKCLVTEAFTSLGSATLAITVASSATEGGTYVTHFSLGATAKTALTLGALLIDMVMPANLNRWVKVTYTIGTADATAGKVTTYMTTD